MSNTHPTVEVLAPENTLPAVQVDYTPEATRQYKRAICGTLEIIRFGAMLIDLDRQLGGSRRNQHSDATLKAWMDQHCPEIVYKTAMRYKALAAGLQEMFNVPATLPLSAALPAPDGAVSVHLPDGCRVSERKVRQLQEAIWHMVEGKSARQLLFDFGSAAVDKGGAHNKPKNLSAEEKHAKQIDAAREVFRRDLDSLLNHVRRSHHLLLGEAHLDVAIHKAEVLLARLKEAKGADKNRQKEE